MFARDEVSERISAHPDLIKLLFLASYVVAVSERIGKGQSFEDACKTVTENMQRNLESDKHKEVTHNEEY